MLSREYKIFRNVCPRNCYDTCGIISYVRDGKLVKVEGDPKHGYTRGRLCSKGYSYTQYVYNENRLRYPLRQSPRGSGKWERISWDSALDIIAGKILDLNQRYGSNLSLAYNKVSGNLGQLHYAVEGMFNSLGAHTRAKGNPCLAAGLDAISYDFGKPGSPDPEDMAHSRLIVLWGTNPAWTAVHQLEYLESARTEGAQVVVIDPLFTPTAAKADIFIQIRPGTDGMLALGICSLLIKKGIYDHDFIDSHTWGWEPFKDYLQEKIDLGFVSEVTGIPEKAIEELAYLYSTSKPCANWVGFGMQRSINGGQNIRAIDALTALSGNVGKRGGGVYYFRPTPECFPSKLLNHNGPDNRCPRDVNINKFAEDVLSLDNPPVKLLWVASRNPLSQDQDLAGWRELIKSLELMVTVDLFMTRTAEASDLVLPATSAFEEDDLNISYWHYWLALNQKAIDPYCESKSDLEIARLLTRRLNQLRPGFSNFPYEKTVLDWIVEEITPDVMERYGLESWEDLKEGPKKYKSEKVLWEDRKFPTVSGKFEFYCGQAKENALPAIPKLKVPETSGYPLRLLSPQHRNRLHSQYDFISWLEDDFLEKININKEDALARGIEEGDTVRIFNESGSLTRKVHINKAIPRGIVVIFQGGSEPVNILMNGLETDMGIKESGRKGLAFYDTFVECKKQVKNYAETDGIYL